MNLILIISACGTIFSVWLFFDAKRAEKHGLVAKTLIDNGVDEETAMRKAHCEYWELPWYKRMITPYPKLPTDK